MFKNKKFFRSIGANININMVYKPLMDEANINYFIELMANPQIEHRMSIIRNCDMFYRTIHAMIEGFFVNLKMELVIGDAGATLVADSLIDAQNIILEYRQNLEYIWDVAKQHLDKYPEGMAEQLKNNLESVTLDNETFSIFLKGTFEKFIEIYEEKIRIGEFNNIFKNLDDLRNDVVKLQDYLNNEQLLNKEDLKRILQDAFDPFFTSAEPKVGLE